MERAGILRLLSEPNLTALSGETANFLAGGEFPVPSGTDDSGNVRIDFKQFGVGLGFTPVVLSEGRISLKVSSEVSELTSEGALTMPGNTFRNQSGDIISVPGMTIPGLRVRRAETTVELGSGESFMIAGLLNNRSIGAIDKIPGLGDIPVLGTLFKSDSFRRGETELVIVVTPYLVQPVSANEIKLPTDAFQDSNDLQRLLLGQTSNGVTGGDRPKPRLETTVGDADRPRGSGDASPGFSIKK